MDEQAKEALQLLIDSIRDGQEFVVEQAPLVVQEIIRWGMFKHGALVVVWLVAMLIGIGISRGLYRESMRAEADDRDEDQRGFVALTLFALFVALVMLVFAVISAFSFGYVYTAPRLYVLDELTRMLRRVS